MSVVEYNSYMCAFKTTVKWGIIFSCELISFFPLEFYFTLLMQSSCI